MAEQEYHICVMGERFSRIEKETTEAAVMIKEMSRRFSEILEATHEMQKEQHKLMFGDNENAGAITDLHVLKSESAKRQTMQRIIFTAAVTATTSGVISTIGFIGIIIWKAFYRT